MATVAELFEDLDRKLKAEPERTRGVNAAFQFVITGEGGGDWVLHADDGSGSVEPGTAEDAKVTLTMTAEDYIGMATGALSGQDLFFAGKMRVNGDQFLAMKLAEITR